MLDRAKPDEKGGEDFHSSEAMTQEGQGLQQGITGCFIHSLHVNRYLAAAARLLVQHCMVLVWNCTLTLMAANASVLQRFFSPGLTWFCTSTVLSTNLLPFG